MLVKIKYFKFRSKVIKVTKVVHPWEPCAYLSLDQGRQRENAEVRMKRVNPELPPSPLKCPPPHSDPCLKVTPWPPGEIRIQNMEHSHVWHIHINDGSESFVLVTLLLSISLEFWWKENWKHMCSNKAVLNRDHVQWIKCITSSPPGSRPWPQASLLMISGLSRSF